MASLQAVQWADHSGTLDLSPPSSLHVPSELGQVDVEAPPPPAYGVRGGGSAIVPTAPYPRPCGLSPTSSDSSLLGRPPTSLPSAPLVFSLTFPYVLDCIPGMAHTIGDLLHLLLHPSQVLDLPSQDV